MESKNQVKQQPPTPSQNFYPESCLVKRQLYINQPHDTGVFTTFSGMVGGVVKAISVKPVMMAITSLIGQCNNICGCSAGIGYIVKKALDKISERINSKFNQNQNSKTMK